MSCDIPCKGTDTVTVGFDCRCRRSDRENELCDFLCTVTDTLTVCCGFRCT